MNSNYPLKISQVSKSFKKPILDKIDLTVLKGEIFGFIGLNGQGKTTLIKIILDLLDQDEGDVEIFGLSRVLPEARKKIFYLPEKFQPSINQTGVEFIEFVLGFYNKKYQPLQAKKIAENLEFDYEVLPNKISKYSKGMTQKLGLIATFMSGAELIILDEPMSGLDPKARNCLKNQLLDYQKNHKTIFFSSHILSDMDEICDKIAILNNTKISFSGTPMQLKNKHHKQNLDQAFLTEILS